MLSRTEGEIIPSASNSPSSLHGRYRVLTERMGIIDCLCPGKWLPVLHSHFSDIERCQDKDQYLIPYKVVYFNPLYLAMTFKTLEGDNRYWRIDSVEADHSKTLFRSPHGLFCFTRMALGLKMSQWRFKERWTSNAWNVRCSFYLKILQTPNNDIKHARQFLTVLNNANVTLNLRKWESPTNHIEYIGQIILSCSLKFWCHQSQP